MRVAVSALRDGQVNVEVVSIIMSMGVLMLDRLMAVVVGMAFDEVQGDAGKHQQSTDEHSNTDSALAQGKGEGSADEGRESKHGCSARRAERSLR